MHVRRFNIYSGHHTVQVTAAPCPPFTSDFIALYWVAVPRGLHPLRPSIHSIMETELCPPFTSGWQHARHPPSLNRRGCGGGWGASVTQHVVLSLLGRVGVGVGCPCVLPEAEDTTVQPLDLSNHILVCEMIYEIDTNGHIEKHVRMTAIPLMFQVCPPARHLSRTLQRRPTPCQPT
jgi:hypothetical protein